MKSKIRLDAKVYTKPISPEKRSEIHRLLDEGKHSYFQISELTGVRESTVNNVAYQRRKQARELEAQEHV